MTAIESPPPNLGLGEILQVLRRRWRQVALITIVVGGLILGVTLSEPKQYKATAVLLVRTVDSDTAVQADPNAQAPDYAARQQMNAQYNLESSAQIAAVKAQYHGPLNVDSVKATALNDLSDAIDLTVTGKNPRDAANLVNLYANVYIARTQATVAATLKAGEAQLEQEIAALDAQQKQVAAPLTALQEKQAANPTDPNLYVQIQTLSVQLEPQIAAIQDQATADQLRLQDLKASAGLTGEESAGLVTQATPPSSPISPKPVRNGAIGFVLGLGLGIAFALGREFMKPATTSGNMIDLGEGLPPTLSGPMGGDSSPWAPDFEPAPTEPVPATTRRVRRRPAVSDPVTPTTDGIDSDEPVAASPSRRRDLRRSETAEPVASSRNGAEEGEAAPAPTPRRRERRRAEPKVVGDGPI